MSGNGEEVTADGSLPDRHEEGKRPEEKQGAGVALIICESCNCSPVKGFSPAERA